MESIIEEFKTQLSAEQDEIKKINLIQDFVWFNSDLYTDECRPLIDQALALSQKHQYERGIAYANALTVYLGIYNLSNNTSDALERMHQAIEVFTRIGDKEGESRLLNMISYMNWWEGKYDLALDQAFRALRLAEEFPDKKSGMCWTSYALGVFHSDLKDYASSEKYFLNGLEMNSFSSVPNTYFSARSNSGLGSVYIALGKFDKALEHIHFALKGYTALKHPMGESRAQNDMGVIERIRGNYSNAEKYLLDALRLREQAKFKQGIATTYSELGELYIKTKQFDKAKEFLLKALALAEEIKSQPKIYSAHQRLSELYRLTGEPWKALEHLQIYHEIKSSVVGEQASNRMKNLQTQFATEKSEKETEIHRLKNVELKKAYEEIEAKNKDIIDSINYARRIQNAILPGEDEIKKAFPGSFVLYKPKDVVSGDFYWFAERGNKKFIAAVDCTGHGVPGAFMSMIGSALLSEIVNEKNISEPGKILDALREGVIKALKQTGAEGENKDGMDIALCVMDGNKLQFAGANNPLWIISKNECKEIKADKQPIGIHTQTKAFTNHALDLKKGDNIYIFTDGYADQFGGEKGKKFKQKNLQQLLISISDKPLSEQKKIIDDTIENWKGNLEQVDDILVIGIKV
ncbi:MAG: tetratricopeptide repeat protein [Bacteroidia bacterium]